MVMLLPKFTPSILKYKYKTSSPLSHVWCHRKLDSVPFVLPYFQCNLFPFVGCDLSYI